MFDLAALRQAVTLIRPSVPATPQFAWPLLAERLGCEVWVKHENHTPTGAFKVRGGLVYVDALLRREPAVSGLISATRGNHGQSMALAARKAGLPIVIVVPHGNAREKNAAMAALGAEVIEHGRDFDAARARAAELATQRGLHFVPSLHRPDPRCGHLCPGVVRGRAATQAHLRAHRPGLGHLRSDSDP